MEVNIRASSIANLFDCPLRWSAIHIDGRTQASSPPAAIGSAIHAGAAAFDAARTVGSPISVDEAAGAVIDLLTYPAEEVDWRGENRRKAEVTALTLHTRYCNDYSPTMEFEAVEYPLESLRLDMGDDLYITLTGTLDRVISETGERGVGDIKTGRVAVNREGQASTRGHGPQIGVYELLYEHTTGLNVTLPGRIIGAKTTGQPLIGIGQIGNGREILLGGEDHLGMIDLAAQMLRGGTFHPNPRSILCGEKFCPIYPCAYKERI